MSLLTPNLPFIVVGSAAAVLAVYFYFSSTPRRRSQIKGITNLGNTCFANALLQSLASCPQFISWLDQLKSFSDQNQLLYQLHEILENINKTDEEEISAAGVIASLEKHGWKIDHHTQQDLFELYNVFITVWDDELSRIKNQNSKPISFNNVPDLASIDVGDNARKSGIKGNELLLLLSDFIDCDHSLKPPCSGLIATQFLCSVCGYKKVRHDTFCSISLSLPKISCRPCVSVDHCLRKYFGVEKLYNVTCDACKEKSSSPVTGSSNFYKNSGFSKLPPCLILHLDRVNWLPIGTAYKQEDHVQFEEYLNVEEFMFYNKFNQSIINTNKNPLTAGTNGILGGRIVSNRPSNSSLQPGRLSTVLKDNTIIWDALEIVKKSNRYFYRLQAVVAHLGDSNDCGHFVCFRRVKKSSGWYFTSDDDVRKVSFATVTKCQAYMLFYERLSLNSDELL